jgi:hypothetical protein
MDHPYHPKIGFVAVPAKLFADSFPKHLSNACVSPGTGASGLCAPEIRGRTVGPV